MLLWRTAFSLGIALFCVAQAPAKKAVSKKAKAPVVKTVPVQPAAAAPTATAASASTPAIEASKLAPARSPEFSIPVYYDFTRDFQVLLPLEFEYDLTRDSGGTLVLGKVALNQNNFNFTLSRVEESEVLLIRFPEYLLSAALLEMISRGGRVLWKYEIPADELKNWKLKNAKEKSDKQFSIGIFKPSEKGAPFASVDEPFRFCLTQGQGTRMTRLCSDQHIVQRTQEGLRLARQTVKTPLRVLFQNEEAPAKKLVTIDRKKLVQFYADLTSGISYEFVSMPPANQVTDVSLTNTPNLYRVVGWDVFPLAPYRIINEEVYPAWVKKWGFEPTIKDERKFWETGIRGENPVVYFAGEGGGVFRQKINIANIPVEPARVFLRSDTPKATYWNSVPLFGRKTSEAKAESKEDSVEATLATPPDPKLFTWNFRATEKSEINKSYLTASAAGKSYLGYYDVYRARANELSGRFTGVYSDGSTILLAEIAYNFWLESIFGNPNRLFSFQRWGLSGKYFKSMAPLPTGTSGEKGNLDVMVLDGKYRLVPGVWTRDETVGLIGSLQTINFGNLSAGMLGVGAFWARSMPAVFDRWFSKFPLMNYPKWVDMEFIMYLQPLNSSVSLGSTYSLNFHGQVLWSKNIFGEAGFGLKRYAFTDNSKLQQAQLSTLYGTLGLGIKF